jgi:hypothetical protein
VAAKTGLNKTNLNIFDGFPRKKDISHVAQGYLEQLPRLSFTRLECPTLKKLAAQS